MTERISRNVNLVLKNRLRLASLPFRENGYVSNLPMSILIAQKLSATQLKYIYLVKKLKLKVKLKDLVKIKLTKKMLI